MKDHDTSSEDPIVSAFGDDGDDDTSNERKAKTKTKWEWSMELLNAGVRASVIIGVFFTGYQYLASVEREKTQRSFELVDLWESDRIQNADTILSSRLQALQDEANTVLGQDPSAKDPAFIEAFVAQQLLEETKSNKDLSGAFTSVVYFLNRVSNCGTSNLCNPTVLNDFFNDYTRQFWGYFGENLKRDSSHDISPIEKYLNARPRCVFRWCWLST